MQITRQADYAVRAVMYLSKLKPEEKVSTNKIAESQSIPVSFLAKIIAQLSVVGLLNTMRGARGGVALARPANEISLLEVVEAIDGPITLNDCLDGSYDCPIVSCKMQGVWGLAQSELISRLSATNFA